MKIKKYEIKFKPEKNIKSYYETSPEIKTSAKIHFYDKNNFNCLCISEIYVTEINKKLWRWCL